MPLTDLQKPIVDIDGLCLWVGGQRLINGLTISLPAGSRLGITGPSGCGKTTLLRSIVQRRLNSESNALRFDVLADTIAYSPQSGGLFPWFTVRDNLSALVSPEQGSDRRQDALAGTELEKAADRQVSQLSGGELQRARLGLAMTVNASLFCADEPLTEVGLRQRWRILSRWSEQLARTTTSLILVSHDVDTLLFMCDQVCVLDHVSLTGASEVTTFLIDGERHPRPLDSLSTNPFNECRQTLTRLLYR